MTFVRSSDNCTARRCEFENTKLTSRWLVLFVKQQNMTSTRTFLINPAMIISGRDSRRRLPATLYDVDRPDADTRVKKKTSNCCKTVCLLLNKLLFFLSDNTLKIMAKILIYRSQTFKYRTLKYQKLCEVTLVKTQLSKLYQISLITSHVIVYAIFPVVCFVALAAISRCTLKCGRNVCLTWPFKNVIFFFPSSAEIHL